MNGLILFVLEVSFFLGLNSSICTLHIAWITVAEKKLCGLLFLLQILQYYNYYNIANSFNFFIANITSIPWLTKEKIKQETIFRFQIVDFFLPQTETKCSQFHHKCLIQTCFELFSEKILKFCHSKFLKLCEIVCVSFQGHPKFIPSFNPSAQCTLHSAKCTVICDQTSVICHEAGLAHVQHVLGGSDHIWEVRFQGWVM